MRGRFKNCDVKTVYDLMSLFEKISNLEIRGFYNNFCIGKLI